MRIGIDISPLTRARTGVGNYVFYLLKHLLLEEKEHVYCPFSAGQSKIVIDNGWHAFLRNGTLREPKHIRLPARALYRIWETFGRPRADALVGGAEVFHATNYFLPPVKRARRVLTIYDMAFLRAPELCSPKIVGPFARNVPRFARAADAIITCSEAAKRDIVELAAVPPEKVSVAYGAVDDGFEPVPRGEAAAALRSQYGIQPPFLLFAGTLEPRKNIDGLLQAFALVHRAIPHQLVLAGGLGWRMDHLEAKIESLGLTPRVTRVGYLPDHNDLAAFYSAADALVFPSLYEGFGLPVVEAMTCGCPVIVSEGTSLPEVAGPAGEYVRPEDPESIAHAIRRVVEDPARNAGMRQEGLIQARRFSWADCARITRGVYGSLMK